MSRASDDRDEVLEVLRSAMEVLRGSSDPGGRRDLVVAVLFLKHICDVRRDRRAAYERRYGGQPALVAELLKNERFVIPEHASFDALYAARNTAGSGERLDAALRAIEEANITKLHHVFDGVNIGIGGSAGAANRDRLVRRLLELFAPLDLGERQPQAPQRIVSACEFLLGGGSWPDAGKSSEAPTPRQVRSLMARLVDPRPGDTVCDPVCGLGWLLAACAGEIRQHASSAVFELHGQETQGRSWALARLNLLLQGLDNHRIEWGHTLDNPKIVDGEGRLRRFDVVLAHLPFSIERWDHEGARQDRHERFRVGVPPRAKAEFAFILHMVQTMKSATGRMAVVVPHGVLFRGASEARIRRHLVERNLLEAVIGLPKKLFLGSAIPTAILLFRMNKTDDKVLFIDASRDYEDGKKQNRLRGEDVERILDAVRARQSIDRYAHLADMAQIEANHHNLHIPRYVDVHHGEPGVEFSCLHAQRLKLQAELAVLEAKVDRCLAELGHA